LPQPPVPETGSTGSASITKQPATGSPGQQTKPETPAPGVPPQDFGRNLQRSIESQVNAHVAQQLRQTQKAVSETLRKQGITAPSIVNDPAAIQACADITKACKAAGFVNGSKSGNGVGSDCIVPLINGTPQPATATIPLPQVSPDVIARCKATNPGYGKLGNKDSSSGSEASDSH
jgi:hypothetical protein